MRSTPASVLIRLPNYVGDVILCLPALALLEANNVRPVLVGKRWSAALLAPFLEHGWIVSTYPSGLRQRIACLRDLAAQHAIRAPRAGLDAVVFPNSFSSALEMRLAGLHAVGHRSDARRWLLGKSLQRNESLHEMKSFFRLAATFLGQPDARAGLPIYPINAQLARAANERLLQHGVSGPFVVACPFSGGLFRGQTREWPDFEQFVLQQTRAGIVVLVCPGSQDELTAAREKYPTARILPDVPLPEYAALMASANAVIANDTGPGHLGAAAGARLLTIAGPSFTAKYIPLGKYASVVQSAGSWPTISQVSEALEQALHQKTP